MIWADLEISPTRPTPPEPWHQMNNKNWNNKLLYLLNLLIHAFLIAFRFEKVTWYLVCIARKILCLERYHKNIITLTFSGWVPTKQPVGTPKTSFLRLWKIIVMALLCVVIFHEEWEKNPERNLIVLLCNKRRHQKMAWAQLAEGSPKKPFFLFFLCVQGSSKTLQDKRRDFWPKKYLSSREIYQTACWKKMLMRESYN